MQRLNRVQAGGFSCREKAKEHVDRGRKEEGNDNNPRIEDKGHLKNASQADRRAKRQDSAD
jgi:hypothetical protein